MTKSIERSLLRWVLGALALGAALLVWTAYVLMLEELDEVFDENLKQVALAVAAHHGTGTPLRRDALPAMPNAFEQPGDFDHAVVVWGRDGVRRFQSDPAVGLAFTNANGLSRQAHAGARWWVYSLVRAGDVVQVAQRESSRSTLAAEVAGQLAWPLFTLVLLTGVLLVVALRRGLRPLDRAAGQVAALSAASLVPIDTQGLPREIHPMIVALNALMQRLAQAFAGQRRFVADAAHELRSPLTALRLQVQRLERAEDDAGRGVAVAELKAGIERAQRLVGQLLSLSRVEPDSPLQPPRRVDLGALARQAVGQRAVEAAHLGLDLGADADDGVTVNADPTSLAVLLDNLVGNALRYTPAGGRVDVCVSRLDGRPSLQVIDSGPGIPPDERERVFDRFYRGSTLRGDARSAGSGLGLAIVRAIAERCGAAVSLHTASSGRGLEARVVFPP